MTIAQMQPVNQTPAGVRPPAMPAVRLMIVEDDTSLATGLMRALANEGYEVTAAASGEEALERMRGEPYDLLVLDIGLPGIDGFEVLRRLRAGGYALPVLILTARDAVDDRVRGLDLGADDYMPKPFALPFIFEACSIISLSTSGAYGRFDSSSGGSGSMYSGS